MEGQSGQGKQVDGAVIMERKFEVKSHLAVYAMGITAALSSFVLGYSHVFLSQMEQVIQRKNSLSPQQLSLALTIVVSATNLGEIIGPFMYKWLAERCGEAKAMVCCNIVVILSVMIQMMKLKIAYLLVGRVVLGMAIGVMSCILPPYLHSIAPRSISGKICSLNQIMICLGVIAAYLMGFNITRSNWRIMIGLPIVPCLASIIGFHFFPFDNLQRHIKKGEKDKIKQYLSLVYKDVGVSELREEAAEKQVGVRREYAHQTERYIIAIVAIVSCQLCGINGIFYYAKQLFVEVTGGDAALAQKLMLGLSLCQAAASLLCSFFVDSFGRKYLMLGGQRVLIFILFCIFMVDNLQDALPPRLLHFLIAALIYAHVIAFNFSLGPICIIYAAELVPDMTPIIVALRSATFLVALSTNYIIHEFGIGQLFLLFGVLSCVAHVYLSPRVRETRGRSQGQVAWEWQQEGARLA